MSDHGEDHSPATGSEGRDWGGGEGGRGEKVQETAQELYEARLKTEESCVARVESVKRESIE